MNLTRYGDGYNFYELSPTPSHFYDPFTWKPVMITYNHEKEMYRIKKYAKMPFRRLLKLAWKDYDRGVKDWNKYILARGLDIVTIYQVRRLLQYRELTNRSLSRICAIARRQGKMVNHQSCINYLRGHIKYSEIEFDNGNRVYDASIKLAETQINYYKSEIDRLNNRIVTLQNQRNIKQQTIAITRKEIYEH